MMKIPLIIVCGATASGKTGLGIELAKKLDGEIISADSMQIYKGMDIATAKPTEAEKCGVVHHLMDFVPPETEFSVADFVNLAHDKIADIKSRGKTAIVVGGTGLYIDSLANDIDFTTDESDRALRAELEKLDTQTLISELEKVDEKSAKALHPNNRKRIVRAVEFYRIYGVPISEHNDETKKKNSRYNPLYLMIDHERETLYERINKRVDLMMEAGLLAEAKRFYAVRDTLSNTARQAIGYSELFEYFDGKCSQDEAIDAIKQNSRRYAKRQLTWFRRNEKIHRLNPENATEQALKLCDEFLSNKKEL